MSLWDIRSWRSAVYDKIIVKMTTGWYRQALLQIPEGSIVLDVGIGTATSLLANRELMTGKNLSFVGVDYDRQYVDTAEANFKKLLVAPEEKEEKSSSGAVAVSQKPLNPSQLTLHCCSIHDYNTDHAIKFDVIYFSGSFMIIPQQAKALRHCAAMLRPTTQLPAASKKASPIIFTQTFENDGIIGRFVALFKPLFKYVLTIDFGNATFEEDFRKVCVEADVTIDAIVPIRTTPFRREVLVLASPVQRVADEEK
eukprot:GILI01034085.1.p1 GENE.GILI01034085.1~~GILI01034085.1.p1  ORF type:complete len:254 (+),score=60.80 GILI01034085.1:49-810(+)